MFSSPYGFPRLATKKITQKIRVVWLMMPITISNIKWTQKKHKAMSIDVVLWEKRLTLFRGLGSNKNDESFLIGQPSSKQAGDLTYIRKKLISDTTTKRKRHNQLNEELPKVFIEIIIIPPFRMCSSSIVISSGFLC